MAFVFEADGDPVVVEIPQAFAQRVVELELPLLVKNATIVSRRRAGRDSASASRACRPADPLAVAVFQHPRRPGPAAFAVLSVTAERRSGLGHDTHGAPAYGARAERGYPFHRRAGPIRSPSRNVHSPSVAGMDFAISAKAQDYQSGGHGFITEFSSRRGRIRPLPGSRDRTTTVPPVVEELKVKARERGLWNLFLPAESGLTNLEYAPLAELTGWSLEIAPEATQLRGAGHRQHGDPAPVRHRGAAQAVAASRCSTARSAARSR